MVSSLDLIGIYHKRILIDLNAHYQDACVSTTKKLRAQGRFNRVTALATNAVSDWIEGATVAVQKSQSRNQRNGPTRYASAYFYLKALPEALSKGLPNHLSRRPRY